jgi:hypothetical protein
MVFFPKSTQKNYDGQYSKNLEANCDPKIDGFEGLFPYSLEEF